MGKLEQDITTAQGRKKLDSRREPYWRREGNGHIGFRCTAAGGEGTWLGRIMHGDKYAYKPFGRLSEFREAAVLFKGWAAELDTMRVAGVKRSAMAGTVGDAVRHYIADSEETRENVKQHLKIQLMLEALVIGREGRYSVEPHPIAEVKLSELTRMDCKEFRKSLLKGYTEAEAPRPIRATASRNLKQFVAVLNKAKEDGLVSTNAAWNGLPGFINTNASHDESFRYLEKEERRQIIDGMPIGERRLFVELLCNLGARPIELERVKVGDWNQEDGTLNLWSYKGQGNNKRERLIPVNDMPKVESILKRVCKDKKPTEQMFSVSARSVAESMEVVCKRLGIEDASSYCFRHSFITDCLTNGLMIHEVARICGTSMEKIDQTYAKLLSSNISKVFKTLSFA